MKFKQEFFCVLCVFVFYVYVQPECIITVQMVITDSFLLGLNVTFPNCSYSQLVILEIEDYALSHVDNQKVLSLIFAILHDLDAHKATHLAMFRVIICHR